MASEPENLGCSSCGTDIRPGTSFCYKCGEPVAQPVTVEGQKAIVSNAWFKEDISTSQKHDGEAIGEQEFQNTVPDADTPDTEAEAIPDAGTEEDHEQAEIAEAEIKPVTVKAKKGRKNLRPASTDALRRKPKLQREKIEMIWDEPETGVNPTFVIGTITIFVLVILILLGVYLMK